MLSPRTPRREHAPTGSPDNYIMAYRTPPFRSSFPMLLASSLLLAQPISSFAASQVQCTPSGNSWSCEPIQARGELPPRPVQATPPPPPIDWRMRPGELSPSVPICQFSLIAVTSEAEVLAVPTVPKEIRSP